MDLKEKYADIDMYGRDENYPFIGIYPYDENVNEETELKVSIFDFPEFKGYNVEMGIIRRYTCKLTLKKLSK